MSTTGPWDDRRVALSSDRHLIVRRANADDVDGVSSLYDRLDDDDRYRRFFSLYRPGRAFVEKMLRAESRGGAVLVAEVVAIVEGVSSGQIVAEADFELLPNGDGELAITVDASWRGWLGPYLLDALIERAAQCGLPNLEAEVLTSNGPMRALLRSRGQATVPGEDWCTRHVLVGTNGRTPSWPTCTSGLRVLIEGSPNGRIGRDAASSPGVQVLACSGPAGRRSPCPVLTGEPCPLAAGADVIVVANPPEDDDWDTLRQAHQRLHQGVPVCVELHGASKVAWANEVELTETSNIDTIGFVQRLATDARSSRSDEHPDAR